MDTNAQQLSLLPGGINLSCKDFNDPPWPIKNKKKYREGMVSFFGIEDPQRFVDGFLLALGKRAQPDVVKLENYLRQKHGIPSTAEMSLNELVREYYGEAALQWLNEIFS